MSLSPPTTSSSNLQAIFEAALKEYQRNTKKDLLAHPLAPQLQVCRSPSDILAVLRDQIQKFDQSTNSDERLTRSLVLTVKVLYSVSGTFGESVGELFSPVHAIFTGVGVLLLAIENFDASQVVIELFECIENFFRRLESYIAMPMTASMTDIIVKIMAEILNVLGLVTEGMKRGRAKKYLRKLIGRRDIECALIRLDKLTTVEAQLMSAEALRISLVVGQRVETSDDRIAHAIDLALERIGYSHMPSQTPVRLDTNALIQWSADNIDEDRPFPHPIRLQVFFGRNDELNTIIDLIFSSPSSARIAILGPGGVGKTALALAVITNEKVVSRFGDSCYFVPCESLMSRDALLAAIANSLSVLQPEHGTTSQDRTLRLEVLSALGSEECILCLDNFESPWDQPGPSRRAVEVLLADITAKSCVTVLITMRGAERPKETAWTLPMLPPLTNFPRDDIRKKCV